MSESSAVVPHASSKTFGRLLELIRPQWGMVVAGLILLLLSMPAELFPGIVWMYVADDLLLHDASSTSVFAKIFSFNGMIAAPGVLLCSAIGWMIGVYLFGEILGTASTNIMNRVAQKFVLKLRNQVYEKLQRQGLGYLQKQRTGDLMSRAMGDIDEVQSFIVNGIDVIIGEGLLWCLTVVVVFWLDWRVALASLSPLIVVYVLLRIFNKRVQPIYKAARDRAGDVSSRLQENLGGIVVIKIFGREKKESARFRDTTEAYYTQQIKAINARSIYFPFARAVGFLSNPIMLAMGGFSILTHRGFTLGKLLAFRAYWWRLFGPIQTLARVNDMVQRSVAASRRIFEVLDAPEDLVEATDAVALTQIRGSLALQNVTFAYREKDVLHDVSIRIEPGQTVALCGPSGSGKSTVLNLLLRFYDPSRGAVTLDGVDLRKISAESLHSHFALVQQESFLFDDTILDNIRYARADATMEQVVAAARAANAHEFIEGLAQGYESRVGERGVRLSGGQKQRISIARAFLANPQILLLDEPTSSVEPDSEAAIIAALDRLMAGRTTVLTSHRPSLINQADVVYVIQDGRVIDSGSPAEVRRRGGWFARFMSSAEASAVASDPTFR